MRYIAGKMAKNHRVVASYRLPIVGMQWFTQSCTYVMHPIDVYSKSDWKTTLLLFLVTSQLAQHNLVLFPDLQWVAIGCHRGTATYANASVL